ncbi:hypothetical protein NDU88_005505 [Pleurodeles waltl]|uniref:Uncharacterized protein n=1 Tax=Pleurodeles waltl TaxID=8319 RepID=A0AAV7WC03_PLEWA|nr:hypothetical protein NDU88_005505 [Pleurodeles waltl]
MPLRIQPNRRVTTDATRRCTERGKLLRLVTHALVNRKETILTPGFKTMSGRERSRGTGMSRLRQACGVISVPARIKNALAFDVIVTSLGIRLTSHYGSSHTHSD